MVEWQDSYYMPLDYKILTWLLSHSIDGTHEKKYTKPKKKKKKKNEDWLCPGRLEGPT